MESEREPQWAWPREAGVDAKGNRWISKGEVIAWDGRVHRKASGVRLVMRGCRLCAAQFSHNLWGGSKGEYCSNACACRASASAAGKASARSPARPANQWIIDSYLRRPLDRCLHCGVTFRPARSKSGDLTMFCGRACKHAFRTAMLPRVDPYCRVAWCEDCGSALHLTHGNLKLCKPCNTARQQARVKSLNERYRERRAAGLEYKPEKLARFTKHGQPVTMGITWQTVSERYGMTCGHCLRECTEPDGQNLPSEATLGHLVPLSQGGPHSWDNVRIECRACNDERGTQDDLIAELARHDLDH